MNALPESASRLDFIDRLRVLLSALVIVFHVAIAYGGAGGWYWRVVDDLSQPLSIALTVFCAVCQAFFMGMFFLLAGSFLPSSLERKGPRAFLLDRVVRLGIPLLVYGFFIGPLTIAIARGHDWQSTLASWGGLLRRAYFNPGPLWFNEALLVFTLVAVIVRQVRSAPRPGPDGPEVPGDRAWLAAALVVGTGAVALRAVFPLDVDVLGMTLGFFSSYIVLFSVGVIGAPHRWLERVTARQARRWVLVAVLAFPTLPIVGAATGLFSGRASGLSSGTGLANLVYAYWEPFIAWGIIAGLVVVVRQQRVVAKAFWRWCARNAYAAYIVHPPIVVVLCKLAAASGLPVLLQFLAVGVAAPCLSFLAGHGLGSLPGARRVL